MRLAALILVALLISCGCAFELKSSWLAVAGRSKTKGAWLWRPHSAVNFDSNEGVAVTVSFGPTRCTETTDTLPALGLKGADYTETYSACPSGVLFSGDGGRTFEVAHGVSQHYCGSLGAVRGGKLYCPGERITDVPANLVAQRGTEIDQEDAAEAKRKGAAGPTLRPQRSKPVIAFEELEYTLSPTLDTDETREQRRQALLEGKDQGTTNAVFAERKTGNFVTFDQSNFKSPIEKIRRGGGIVHAAERQIRLCNLEVTFGNGSSIHAAYKSTNGGSHWSFLSIIPLPFSRHSSMLRMSDTRILVVSGEIGAMNQTTSLFLGNKWEKNEKSAFTMPSSTYISKYFTTVASGVVPRPVLGFVGLGSKKNSQQSIVLTKVHNELSGPATDQGSVGLRNYTDAFIGANEFDCLNADSANTDATGCSSSGFVAVVAADSNGTVLILYDQLAKGFRPTEDVGEHTIYTMRVHVNETVEAVEYEVKVLQEKKSKDQEKENELAAAKRREEAKAKAEKDKKDQRRRNKARRNQWKKMDEAAQQSAADYHKVDGQWIVVRSINEEFIDIEKEMF